MDLLNNNTFNPMMGPGMMMGGNFIDIMFKHLMEKGLEGLSWMVILNFYMYMSLDRIKDLFRYFNDKIGEKAKTYTEHYSTVVVDKTKSLAASGFERIKHVRLFKRKHVVIETPMESDVNKVSVNVTCANKIDLMALGNFILQNRDGIDLHDYCRDASDKYKTTEKYVLPNCLKLVTEEGYTIRMMQNVELTLVCETDSKLELLKDVTVKVSNALEKKVSWSDFTQFVCSTTRYPRGLGRIASFASSTLGCWGSSANSFCNNSSVAPLLLHIHCSKNFELFKTFCTFLKGKGSFDFCGIRYQLDSDSGAYHPKIHDEGIMDKFLEELEKYVDDKLLPDIKGQGCQSAEEWIAENKHKFDPVIITAPGIDLHLESTVLTRKDLAIRSKTFMNDLIKNYYNQNHDNIGNKISIYQLHIVHEITKKKRENPRYAEWQEKYGETEEAKEEKKAEKTEGGDKAKPEEKKDVDKSKDKQETAVPPTAYPDYNEYGYAYRGPYKPREPLKFIEEEIMTPVAEAKFIKADKKPMQYLYLERDAKELLVRYLTNFKDNRELYEKMGIPYKGGVLLSGAPGCGKTSTILALACFLNKNIYYLDLGKIKTNTELKLCVDYIKVNSQKGGVVIFEDIDCMSNIVKRRTGDTELVTSITKNMDTDNDQLSLSFLLNILDGTMSPEDILFVMTTNHKEVLDEALIRCGRVDIAIEINKCDKYQLSQIYFDLYNKTLDQGIVDRFYEDKYITAEIILHLFHNVYNKEVEEETLLKKFLKPIAA